METVKKYLRVDRRQIAYFKFILEAYDGVGVLTTLDAASGRVVLNISPDCVAEAEMIIAALQKEIFMEPLDDPPANEHT